MGVGVILCGDLPGLWIWFDYSQWKELLETFELSSQEYTVGKGAEKADVEVIAVALNRKLLGTKGTSP